jgi:hypothetical protein
MRNGHVFHRGRNSAADTINALRTHRGRNEEQLARTLHARVTIFSFDILIYVLPD